MTFDERYNGWNTRDLRLDLLSDANGVTRYAMSSANYMHAEFIEQEGVDGDAHVAPIIPASVSGWIFPC
ncbi:hypothetical protein [Massilia sp. erpn]|uniref:hypothetical protein n=1 Tax=Massilia sp. erpn TaxID=2738142 RepID=UPI002104D153|nr:hypothetical protein [Massilia sp. erpn]UTY57605.1 hypothetical protein HPQ68_10680 [Massilia sp. erpn]